MSVCFNVQSHRDPKQIHHLVETLTLGSPHAVVLVDHDQRGEPLDVDALCRLGDVTVLHSPGGYADFSHVDRHLAAIRWVLAERPDVDWLVNITGQCYPVRPIDAIVRDLQASDADALLEVFPAFGSGHHWPERLARSRYLFHHRRLANLSPAWKRRLRPVQLVNRLQPLARIHVAYGFTIGWRVRTPFSATLRLHGGSAFMSLRRRALTYLIDHHDTRPALAEHFRRTLSPVEAYFHTILANASSLTVVNDSRRFFDFSESRMNHPRTLSLRDVEPALLSGADFGRKFDMSHDPDAIAALDRRIRRPEERAPSH